MRTINVKLEISGTARINDMDVDWDNEIEIPVTVHPDGTYHVEEEVHDQEGQHRFLNEAQQEQALRLAVQADECQLIELPGAQA